MRGERLLGTPNVLYVHGEDGCTEPGDRKFQQISATVNRDLVRVSIVNVIMKDLKLKESCEHLTARKICSFE